MDRARFFAAVREDPFGGKLTPGQVVGMEAIVDAWERAYPTGDRRQLGYVLGTAFHETGRTMAPVEEVGRGEGRKYGVRDPETGHVYYGRGFVQLTWRRNYDVLGRRLGLNLVRQPELARERPVAARILVVGMVEGLFTGWKLGDFFNAHSCDWRGARRVVNALDRADAIATYARAFHAALDGAGA